MSDFSEVLERLWLPFTLLLVGFCGLIWGISQVKSRYRESKGLAESAHELLTQYQDLRDTGEISNEEYRLIKNRLAENLRRSFSSEDERPESCSLPR